MALEVTYALAMAAAQDAANRSMHKHGRDAWNEDDWNEAVKVFDKLMPESRKGA